MFFSISLVTEKKTSKSSIVLHHELQFLCCLTVLFVCFISSLIWLSSCSKYHNYVCMKEKLKAFNWSYDIDYFESAKKEEEKHPKWSNGNEMQFACLQISWSAYDFGLHSQGGFRSHIFDLLPKKKSLFAWFVYIFFVFLVEIYNFSNKVPLSVCALFLVICFFFHLASSENITFWYENKTL